MRRTARLLLVLLALLAPARAPGQEVLIRALDLEQVGAWNEAATLYRQVLAAEPTNAPALLGLERVYGQVGGGRRDSVLAYAERAIAANPAGPIAYAVELRTLRATGADSLAAAAFERWVAAQPASAAPYREWARLSVQAGRLRDARDAVALARERLRDPAALAPEMALVEVAEADWVGAAGEWRAGVMAQPSYAEAASFSLRPAPVAARDGVLRVLSAPGAGAVAGRRVAADLLLGWNEPGRAWTMLRDVLPAQDSQRVGALRGFAERARSLDGPGAQLAAAQAYDLLAAVGPREEAQWMRIESARAFAASGDVASARRVLRKLADDPAADEATRAAAGAATVELLVREGNPAEAERMLAVGVAGLPGSEREQLSLQIAGGWLRLGALDRAAGAVERDSSLAGDEVRGWVALYRGDLGAARTLLRNAGAETGDRQKAPARAAAVALLDAVTRDSFPELGAALLLAARGDSLQASRALVAAARQLAGNGEAEPAVLSWAAGVAASARDVAGAEALWREIAERFPSSSVAPAAELALARSLADRGDLQHAAARLQAMILAHPQSALVPEARRELDRVRGLVPRS